MRRGLLVVTAATALLLAGCGGGELPANLRGADSHTTTHAAPTASAAPSFPGATTTTAPPAAEVALRTGERFLSVRLPSVYTPKAPVANSTDDYRCFLVDPHFTTDQLVSGVQITPDNAAMVHHVIVSKVAPDAVAAARSLDAGTPGDGWTCFGGAGLPGTRGGDLDDADWVGAWAPGSGERVMAGDIGIPLSKGTQLVVQMHYNLLAATTGTDRSTVRLRLSEAAGSHKKPLQTMLLPAPVELPCRDGRTTGMCERGAAIADISRRFGEEPATADLLHLLCGPVEPGPVQHCTRPVRTAATIRAVAGHMHLLGRAITVDVNKGTPKAKRVLDIPNWNFDDQGSIALKKPVNIGPGDTVTVTCTHDQGLRDLLPSFRGTTERYVAWGEGTTDEMCLGIVLMTAR